jgi:glycosyltransferase involved in cell wall biosynthesis
LAADKRIAFVHGVSIGAGGLAVQSANALAALAICGDVHAFGPPPGSWPRTGQPPRVQWHPCHEPLPRWSRWPVLRRHAGRAQWTHDVRLARAVLESIAGQSPDLLYGFTHVSLEALRWARDRGIPTVLESPNGHIRSFRRIYTDEHARWCRGRYLGPPIAEAVERIEQEYVVADSIRVSSQWAKQSLIDGGVAPSKIHVLQQPVDLDRYQPAEQRGDPSGPLRVVFVGSLDFRKGFVYLLRALRELGRNISLEIVGATVDRCTRILFAREREGLAVRAAPGDPVPAYHRAELCVLPTLEDGSPFAAAEAMACGLPLVTTQACGAAEWVEHRRTGWIVPARDAYALAEALRDALERRHELPEMGRAAREATERRAASDECDRIVAAWILARAAG